MSNLYGIKDSANFTLIKKSTGKPFLYADYATTSENDWKSNRVYAMSKNVRSIAWDDERESTLNVSMELWDLKWIAMLAGSEFVEGATSMLKREVLTASASHTITLGATPAAGSLSIFALDEDNISHLAEQTTGTPATTEDTYSIADLVVTLNTTTAPEGTKFVAYYLTNTSATAKKIQIKSTKFPENYEIYTDTMMRDLDGIDKFVQVHYFNVRPKSEFKFTFSAKDVSKLDVVFDVLKNSTSDDMAEYTIL
jgi:hypothetical protein